MRKITANIIFPVSSAPLSNHYLVIDDSGKIVDLVPYNRNNEEIAGLEYYSGVLIPGFVNAHCHLELSHLKNTIPQNLGLKRFIRQVQQQRDAPLVHIEKSIEKAMRYMWSRGINAVGDVANYPYALEIKKRSPIDSYNFIELFNEGNKTTDALLECGILCNQKFTEARLKSCLVPHSLYATNANLLNGINSISIEGDLGTMHFLESHWEAAFDTQKIVSYLKKLTNFKNILLVHNLHLNSHIFDALKMESELFSKIFWVLCVNSNQYIKGKLPPLSLFEEWGLKLCLGTDSLASNKQLCILEEMKTIALNFKEIPFTQILKWATLNGAHALDMDAKLGSFDKGKRPGVLLIESFNFKTNGLCHDSGVSRLV